MGGNNPAGFGRFAEIEQGRLVAEARRERLAMEALAGAGDSGRDTAVDAASDAVRARRRLFHSVVWAVARVARLERAVPSLERPT